MEATDNTATVGDIIGSPYWIEAVGHEIVRAFEAALSPQPPRWTVGDKLAMPNERWDILRAGLEQVLEKYVGIALSAAARRRGPVVHTTEQRETALKQAMSFHSACSRPDLDEAARVRGAIVIYQMGLDADSIVAHSGLPRAAGTDEVEEAVRGLAATLGDLLDVCVKDLGHPEPDEEDSSAVGGGLDGDMAVTFGHMRRGLVALTRYRALRPDSQEPPSTSPSPGPIPGAVETSPASSVQPGALVGASSDLARSAQPGLDLDLVRLRLDRLEYHAWAEEPPEYLQTRNDRIQSTQAGYPLSGAVTGRTTTVGRPGHLTDAEHPEIPGLRAAAVIARSLSEVTGLGNDGRPRPGLDPRTEGWATGHTRAMGLIAGKIEGRIRELGGEVDE